MERSFDFTEGGLTVTATGSSTSLNGFVNPRDVVQTVVGLGVCRNNSCNDPEVNGETLLLSFDRRARINSATFSRVGGNDEFTLLVDGDELVSADIPGGNLADIDIGSFDFTSFNAGDRTGVEFGFTVTDLDDDYILREIVVEKVPEPALVLGLLAASALGASALQRKQK